MGSFLAISLWVALSTIVPGLITIACLYGASVVVNPDYISPLFSGTDPVNEWVVAGFAITVMVLTQAVGILLEGLLVRKQWLGPETQIIQLPEGIDPHGETEVELKPYFEYEGAYILLAELSEHEDSQGHLKRALAQFFLTNNTLISFGAGILFAGVLYALHSSLPAFERFLGYSGVMILCAALSYKVAVIRFDVMARSLWATRRHRP